MSIHIRTVHITTAGLIDYPFIRSGGAEGPDLRQRRERAESVGNPAGHPAGDYRRNQSIYNCWRYLREGSVRALCRITLGRS